MDTKYIYGSDADVIARVEVANLLVSANVTR